MKLEIYGIFIVLQIPKFQKFAIIRNCKICKTFN